MNSSKHFLQLLKAHQHCWFGLWLIVCEVVEEGGCDALEKRRHNSCDPACGVSLGFIILLWRNVCNVSELSLKCQGNDIEANTKGINGRRLWG